MKDRKYKSILLILGLYSMIIAGCANVDSNTSVNAEIETSFHTETIENTEEVKNAATVENAEVAENPETEYRKQINEEKHTNDVSQRGSEIDISEVPEYDGSCAYYVFDATPVFSQEEIDSDYFIELSELDSLGRCGVATMKATSKMLPTEERGKIGNIRPSGWHTVKFNEDSRYEGLIDGNYLYNRCHLLMYALSGLNAEERNLITGTRFLNIEGMLPFENKYLEYVSEGNELLYRVTPIFYEEELVCRGVLLEAFSCSDDSIRDMIYCYNVQPGIVIDYATGESAVDEAVAESIVHPSEQAASLPIEETGSYVVNDNNGKIHINGACQATQKGKNAMKNPVYFDTYEEAEQYSISIAPKQEKRKCGNCNFPF